MWFWPPPMLLPLGAISFHQVLTFQVFIDNGLGTNSCQVHFNERLGKTLKAFKIEGNNFLLMNI